MSRVFLRSISIEGFRGINNIGDPLVLRFRPDCVNSVYAYNGVGKTSIYEAVYYAIFGKVTRLDQLQDAEHGSDYIVNRFHDLQTATIVLSFEPDDGSPGITVSVVKPAAGARAVTSPSGHADPEAFLSSLQEDFVLVDYARFTSFVECSPLHRGRSFSALVGLSQYSNLRQALEGAKDTRSFNTDFGQPALDTEIAGIERSAGTTRQAIAQSYETATGKPSAELPEFSLAADQVTAVLKGTPALASYAGEGGVLALDFETAEREIEKIDGGPERQKWAALLETASSLEKAALGPGEVAEIEGLATLGGERDGAVQRAGRADTLALLKSADKVYKDHAHDDPLQCPLCLSRLTEPLPERIRAQIAHYEEADGFSRRLCAEVKASTALQRLGTLEGMAVLRVAQPDRLAALLLAQAQAGEVKSVSLTAASAAVRNLEARRTAVLDETRTAAATAEASIPPSLVTVTKLLSAAKQFRDGISRHTRETAPLAEKKRRASLIKRWRDFLTAATERFCEAEGRLSTTRLEEIKTVYQRLYGDIMRGGPNLQPTLARANGSENLDLVLADFFGLPNLNARALLSESYRNAVATSIFLAAASKHSGTPRFIILDDVTSSFDAGHQVALMETLRTDLRHPANPDGPQFILLSHDTALEKYFDRLGGTTGWPPPAPPRDAAGRAGDGRSSGGGPPKSPGAAVPECWAGGCRRAIR